MKNKSKYIQTGIKLFIVLILFNACEDFLDVNPGNDLTEEQHFNNIYDADAAVRGIYGKLVELADEYVILNELRADLMDVTFNANINLRQINLHEATADNPYANPQKFFSIINDCNDALVHFDVMLQNLKISEDAYNQRYADILTLRSWLYLQLVIHYGHVPYITEPIDQVKDLKALKDSVFPVLNIEQMIDTLIACMETVPTTDPYTDATMRTSIDGYGTYIMFIEKNYFMGELYLWQGEYTKSAAHFKQVMEKDIGFTEYNTYKIPTDFFADEYYNSRYVRYYETDINSIVNNWPNMFGDIQTVSYFGEWIWTLYFDDNYNPENPFIDLFAGNYYLQPSQTAINNWDKQVQKNGFTGDFRGENGSYFMSGNFPVITKFIMNYNYIDEPFNKSGKWYIWRAGSLHLRFSEAANRDNIPKLAHALTNDGIKATYAIPEDTSNYTRQNQTLLAFPYDFDGRQTGSSDYPPGVRGLYYRNMGIRGRVYLQPIEYPDGVDSIEYTEDKILEEAALELAFEGERWGDLVRIAIRRNDPSFLADKIYDKLSTAGYPEAEAVRSKLMERENWFIPY